MRRFGSRLGPLLFAAGLALLPAAGFGEEELPPDLVVCGEPVCEVWAPKGENTCPTCSIALCKAPEGKQLVGHHKRNECYPGHGEPPPDESEE
jgi:hypothetical protein